MKPDAIDDIHIVKAAAAVDLDIDPAHIAGTIFYFQLIAGFASLVNEFPLDESDDRGPIFTPCLPTTRE